MQDRYQISPSWWNRMRTTLWVCLRIGSFSVEWGKPIHAVHSTKQQISYIQVFSRGKPRRVICHGLFLVDWLISRNHTGGRVDWLPIGDRLHLVEVRSHRYFSILVFFSPQYEVLNVLTRKYTFCGKKGWQDFFAGSDRVDHSMDWLIGRLNAYTARRPMPTIFSPTTQQWCVGSYVF